MFLNEPTLNISFRCVFEGKSYMMYASTGEMRCFDCGSIGHVRLSCPHRVESENEAGPSNTSDKRKENEVLKSNVPNEVAVVNNEGQNVDSNLKAGTNLEDPSPNIEKDTEEASGSKTKQERLKRVNVVTDVAVERSTVVQGSGQGDTVERSENISQTNDEPNGLKGKVLERGKIVSLIKKVQSDMFDEEMEDDDDDGGGLSDFSDVSDVSQVSCEQVYSLDEINKFLDETFGKSVDVRNYFSDLKRFETSVRYWQRKVGKDELSQRKRFCLKKFLAKLRRDKTPIKRKLK